MADESTKASVPATAEAMPNVNLLLDVPVPITVELGRRRMIIGDLLALGPGSILELNKPAGESLDILAGGKLIAHGEAVVVGDHLGVRVTDVVTPHERIDGIAGRGEGPRIRGEGITRAEPRGRETT